MKWLARAALLAAWPAFAQAPTAVELYGVPLGARERQWQEAFPLARCTPSGDPVFADRVCVVDRQRDGAPIAVGGVTLRDVTTVFVGDRLVQITVTYDVGAEFRQRHAEAPARGRTGGRAEVTAVVSPL